MDIKQPKPEPKQEQEQEGAETDFRAKIAELGRRQRQKTEREIDRRARDRAIEVIDEILTAAGVS